LHFFFLSCCPLPHFNQPFRLGRGGDAHGRGGMHRGGGRGDARASWHSCASPLGTPLLRDLNLICSKPPPPIEVPCYGETWPRPSPSSTRTPRDTHVPARNRTRAACVTAQSYSNSLLNCYLSPLQYLLSILHKLTVPAGCREEFRFWTRTGRTLCW
jgi:hypothetical protein